MIMVVPTDTPVTNPPDVTVATDVSEDVQVPPAGEPASVVEPGKQMEGVPVTVGVVPTVTVICDVQPLAVYVMFVVPLLTPVTTPLVETVPTAVTEDDHVPVTGDPASISVSGIHITVLVEGVMDGSIAVVPNTVTVKPLAVA